MNPCRQFLHRIREPNPHASVRVKIWASLAVAASGFALGLFQKWLDGSAGNELPQILQQLDLVNYFGRFAIWILLATAISVYAKTPIRASVNTFLFLLSMVSGYYLYCRFALGFLPVSYMHIWIVASFLSAPLAFVCWYAKGSGIVAVCITAGIWGVLFAQAFFITQGFRITYPTEVLTWIAGLVILRRKPKEFATAFVLSLAVAFVYQILIPYWG